MKSKILWTILLCFTVVYTGCTKKAITVGEHFESFDQYSKAEFTIELLAEFLDPYVSEEIKLDMELVTPSGKVILLPCFYETGGSGEISKWKARFMAQEIGEYKYVFKLYEKGVLKQKSSSGIFTSNPSILKGVLKPYNNWAFKFDNGDLFRGIGENICWEARDNDDNRYLKELHENDRFNYDYLLTSLAENEGNFFRTWMIYWNLPVDWKIVHNNSRYSNSEARFNESGIKRMDEMVELCDSLGIHFMLALEAHGALLGNGWERNSYNSRQGGPADTSYEFFTLEEAKEMYKDKLRFMVARWGYSPAVGAWEFFNEVDNAMYNGPSESQLPQDIVTNWHREMSDYLKSVDPFGHMITTSVSHRDVEGLNDLPSIDFNQKHIYRDTKSIPSVVRQYSEAHNKPYVIGEFGYEWDWHVNFYDIADEKASDYKRGLWYGLFSPTPILPMSWWWEFFDEIQVRSYLGNVHLINKRMINSGNGEYEDVSVKISDDRLINYAVKCGNDTYVYIYNPNKTDVKYSLSIPIDEGKSEQIDVEWFDCETAQFSLANIESSGIIKQFEGSYLIPAQSDNILIIQQGGK